MNRRLLILLLMAAAAGSIQDKCYAQDQEYGVIAISGPDKVLLLLGKDLLHSSTASETGGWVGYNLYKAESGSDKYRKINESLIARVDTKNDMEEILEIDLELAVRFLKLRDSQELWEMIQNRDERIYTLVLLIPSMRIVLGLSYSDYDVKKNIEYKYVATRVDRNGKESAYSKPSTVTFGIPPYELKGPLNTTAILSLNGVTLTWEANPSDSGAFYFNIYRSLQPTGPFTMLNKRPVVIFYRENDDEKPTGSYSDETVVIGRDYYYSVVDVDIAGNESDKDPILKITPKDNTPPAIPYKVEAKSSSSGNIITWEKVIDTDLSGYFIYRSIIADSLFTRLSEILIPPDTGYYVDNTALPNTQYYYRVTAIDRSGNESAQSATGFTVFESKKRPLPPGHVIAEGTSEGVVIKWRSNEEEDLRGYFVFRADNPEAKPVQISGMIGKDTTFYRDTDRHISPKGTYWYSVQAVNFTGYCSNFSAAVPAVTNKTVSPEPPLSFHGYQDVIGNRLFWEVPMDNTVAGYNIYRAISSYEPAWERLNPNPLGWKQRAYTDSSAITGTEYVYHIKSVNERSVESKPSHSIKLTTFSPPPLPPGNLIISKIKDGLKISWDPTMERMAAGYYLYRRSGNDTINKLTAEPISRAKSEFRDTDLIKGIRYYYSISSVDSNNREGRRSLEVEYYYR